MEPRSPTPPIVLRPNLSGPHELYFDSTPMAELGQDSYEGDTAGAGPPAGMHLAPVSTTHAGPVPVDHSYNATARLDTARLAPHPALNGVRSTPALSVSRQQPGHVKDMANALDQSQSSQPVTTSRDRYRRPAAAAANRNTVVPASTSEGGELRRLQKKPRSPRKSPSMSFESSFSSATSAGTSRTARSQPRSSKSPRRGHSPNKQQHMSGRPLFGEITPGGNFDLGNYVPQTMLEKSRRGSEGSLALVHGRSQSYQDLSTSLTAASPMPKLSHKRSRSDMDALRPPVVPGMPDSGQLEVPSPYPTPPDSGTRALRQRDLSTASRIPVSNRRQSSESLAVSNTYSRASSAMSNPSGRRRIDKSPTRAAKTPAAGKENSAASRSRYHPPPISVSQSNQTLSAKIVAPAPKTSPQLRSSRPRQPVSSATTSASRAREAERFHDAHGNAIVRDGRRPSEQWLGKPYDPQKERSRRKIPELDKINFEERRAKIQRAISQSLKSSESQESMRRSQSLSVSESISSKPPSRIASHEHGQATTEPEAATRNIASTSQTQGAASQPGEGAGSQFDEHSTYSSGLTLKTIGLMDTSEVDPEPLTARTDQTMFEDDSPVLGRTTAEPSPSPSKAATEDTPIFLAPATYQASGSKQPAADMTVEALTDEVQSPGVHENVMHMRQRSASASSGTGIEFVDDSRSAEGSLSDRDDKWGSRNGDQGSIQIMLDDDPNIGKLTGPWSRHEGNQFEEDQHADITTDTTCIQNHDGRAFTADGYSESPIDDSERSAEDSTQITPRRTPAREDVFQPTVFGVGNNSSTLGGDNNIAHVLDYYQSTGTLTEDMLAEMQHRMVDLHRLSANGGSDANMIQSLLESIMGTEQREESRYSKQMLMPGVYEIPAVTPDTPPLDGSFEPGTVIVYGNDAPVEEDEDDFEAKIRKADEDWERHQRGDGLYLSVDDQGRPPPPPKDVGYTPRSSTGPDSATFQYGFGDSGLSASASAQLDYKDMQDIGERDDVVPSTRSLTSALAPPLPSHAPPPPPPPGTRRSFTSPEVPAAQTLSERASSELSPRIRKSTWGPSGSSRPSLDSQRTGQQMPASQSMTSFGDSTRQASFDTGETQTRVPTTVSPGPEQKRLLKRRHIMRELLDTEYSYHQDLKIVEDIYKATCTPELVVPEDKKVLFGNCDEVERFALHFYDELRRAAAHVYMPPKQQRWMNNKRSSFSTTQSDGTTQTTADGADDEKDRMTTIGRTFLMNIAQMEKIYGSYLKNHDAANQRLSAIQSATTVKCWLDECHANASDITSAWDLDSLLVKPTQRVAKYPMLLKELVEVTPQDHPDHEDLQTAAKDIIGMLTRINEAKKRADIVDQIINKGKGRKDSDLRGNFSKAFGRRTEKLKERVGIAEAFQDPEFDELAHKFGGHFIRLQICMRDVQDYVHRADKGIELVNNYVEALELFTDLQTTNLAEIQSKWRRYGQIIRELTLIAFGDHKAAVQKRILAPMIQCIKLHEGPQAAINKRKKRLVDYAKCKSDERRGQKPDKKTQDASDAYVALNETLKIELPQLYNLTAKLVQNCLHCFLDVQLKWHSTWERKLRPVLEAADIPDSIQQIEPAFRPDFVEVERALNQLSICNGTLKIEAANFLSPPTSFLEKAESPSTSKHQRPPTLDSLDRTQSVGSENSARSGRRHSGIHSGSDAHLPALDNRMRSNSAITNRVPPALTPGSVPLTSRPWSHSNTATSSSSISRPTTANALPGGLYSRQSSDVQRSPRPESHTLGSPARGDYENNRFSGLFASALPVEMGGTQQQPPSPSRTAPEDMNVLFVCASLFEFSIDKTRREAGYPYLQYVQGEVFDVVAQKGELWLAKNQDDASNQLGWIWEQHFIILSSD